MSNYTRWTQTLRHHLRASQYVGCRAFSPEPQGSYEVTLARNYANQSNQGQNMNETLEVSASIRAGLPGKVMELRKNMTNDVKRIA